MVLVPARTTFALHTAHFFIFILHFFFSPIWKKTTIHDEKIPHLYSQYWPLYFYSIVLFAISSLNIYLALICSVDEVPLEAGFPKFCDISRQLSNTSSR